MGRLCSLALLSFCALQACSRGREAAWLELERVAPELVDLGTVVHIEGESLPAGQAATVRLVGRTQRPGRSPLAVDAVLGARARTDDRIDLPFDDSALCALGCAGTFEGTLTVAFDVRRGQGRVTGSLPVRLDLRGARAPEGPSEQALRERGLRLLRYAGIEPLEEASTLAGLVIGSVRDDGRAADLGLRAGDVLVEVDGVRVHAVSDLAPAPLSRRVLLSVRTGARARSVALDLTGLSGPDLRAELGRVSWLLAWVLACGLLLSPLPSVAAQLGRWRARYRVAPSSSLGCWGGVVSPRRGWSARVRGSIVPLASSAGGVALVQYQTAGVLAVRSISLYLGLLALSLSLTLMADASPLSARVRAAAEILGRMVVTGLLIACACALYGSRSFDGMVQAQGGWPWSFGIFQKPALLVAFPLYVVYASRLGATTLALDPEGRGAHLLVIERVLTNVVLSALGVAIFFGGWQSPAELGFEGVQPRFVGAVLFVAKTWLFGTLLAFARRIELGASLRPIAVSIGCVLTAALTALGLWLGPSPEVELAFGRAVCVSAALYVLASLVRERSLSRAAAH